MDWILALQLIGFSLGLAWLSFWLDLAFGLACFGIWLGLDFGFAWLGCGLAFGLAGILASLGLA